MEKKLFLTQIAMTAILWVYPFYEAIRNGAQSMDDLSRVSRILVFAGTAMLFFMFIPFFKWVWHWLKKWINGN